MAGDHERSSAATVPFWAHQLAEMLLGGLLLIEGARTGQHTAVLVGMGGALLLLSLLSDGALGAWPYIGRRLHRSLDLVAAAILALSPLLLAVDTVLPIVVLEAAALGMLWLALRTNWAVRRVRRARRPAAARPQPEAPAAPAPAAPAAPLARQLGAAVGRARDDGPRQLGRLVGRAQKQLRNAGDAGASAAEAPSEEPPPAGGPQPPEPQ